LRRSRRGVHARKRCHGVARCRRRARSGAASLHVVGQSTSGERPIIAYDHDVTPELSIVIPIRNEAPALKELHRELTQTLVAAGRSYELIVVDDGSTDDSFEILARLQAGDPRLRVIRFRRNFGQTAAFAAGFDYARGRIIVTSDGDLQNDPRDIPKLIERLDAGHDIVCGWRKVRKDPFLSPRLPPTNAKRGNSFATGQPRHRH